MRKTKQPPNAAAIVMRWLGQKWCGMWGHHQLGVMTAGHWYLQCTNCGHKTAGWAIDSNSRPIPVSQQQVNEAVEELVSAELELHGGG